MDFPPDVKYKLQTALQDNPAGHHNREIVFLSQPLHTELVGVAYRLEMSLQEALDEAVKQYVKQFPSI